MIDIRKYQSMSNNDNHFKLKLIKATEVEKIIVFLLVIAVSILYLMYPISLSKDSEFNEKVNINDVISQFAFAGELQKQTIFAGEFGNIVYLNEGNIESHFISISQKKEITINELIKDECEKDFLEKERELLLLKYPQKYVELLLSAAEKIYVFQDDYLEVNYNVIHLINTKRTFNLKMYYKEIADYLEFSIHINPEVQNENGFIYDPNKVSISFTFDDGPNGKRTQALIAALEDYKMTATFFMVGNKLYNDANTVKIVYDSHSEVGYHSYKHAYFTMQSEAVIKEEFAISNQILSEITGGGQLKLTRPPYGAYDKKTLNAIDNVFVRWDLDTNDWRYRDVQYIIDYVLNNYSDGSIVLFHDTYQTSIDAAVALIDTLYLLDVQVLSITDLANLKGINLQLHEMYYDFK
ncbi:MAG: hypothetical protein E7164_02955 [Firmicutes bacterium]|nr:hypothetical protein [Bacillota bacterium]